MMDNVVESVQPTTIVESLAKVVARHLPQVGPGHYQARWLFKADLAAEQWFGRSNDLPEIEDLSRALSAVREKINSMSFGAKKDLGLYLSAYQGKHFDCALDAITDLLVDIELAKKAVGHLRVQERKKPNASRKRNWRAAAVADVCRTIWADASWQSTTGREFSDAWISPDGFNALAMPQDEWSQNVRQVYSDWLTEDAPRFDKADAPGPFGRFLEDILECLGIHGRGAQRLSAASALRALAQAREQKGR